MADAMIAPGVVLKERYRLERLLGRGGMASVWLAADERLERPVAVKVLSDTIASDPEYLARFQREARVAAGLSHPNLIGIYDYAAGDERPFLVMEHVSGGTLAERMKAGPKVDCRQLARELLGALDHIHAAGIVHRDVKPQNVLYAEDGSTRLIDFGIALPPDATALTRTGSLLGTARYIAPEVMAGAAATERSDLYSCGVLLRECVGDARRGSLPALVGQLTATDPGGRPSSAREAVALLDAPSPEPEQVTKPIEARTAEWAPPTARHPAPPPTQPRSVGSAPGPRRSVLAVPAAVLAVVAALVLGALALTGNSDQSGGEPDRRANRAADDGAAASGGEAADGGSEEPASKAPQPTGDDPASGGALNEEGYAMIQEGRAGDAVPVLEEAVRAFPPGTEDLNYAYALFNLGNALRLSGRPDDAIPVLERRLRIPNQTSAVRRELAAARAEASS